MCKAMRGNCASYRQSELNKHLKGEGYTGSCKILPTAYNAVKFVGRCHLHEVEKREESQ